MGCCDPKVYDDTFDARTAERELRAYRRAGANRWTEALTEELARGGVAGLTVLDIGAGIGAVHHRLLEAGAASAIDVDASSAYLAVARREAERRGFGDRVTFLKGDAVGLADRLPDADLVALDRVVCCYADMPALVAVASARARRRLGMVLPRDGAWIRGGVRLLNAWSALTRNPFRAHAHRPEAVLAVATAAGLTLVRSYRGLIWEVLILERPAA